MVKYTANDFLTFGLKPESIHINFELSFSAVSINNHMVPFTVCNIYSTQRNHVTYVSKIIRIHKIYCLSSILQLWFDLWITNLSA